MMSKGEEQHYEQAALEVRSKTVIPGLFAKAFASCDGDEKKAVARYITLRVEQLDAESRVQVEQAKKKTLEAAAREKEKRLCQQMDAERKSTKLDLKDMLELRSKFSLYGLGKLESIYANRYTGEYRHEAIEVVCQLIAEHKAKHTSE